MTTALRRLQLRIERSCMRLGVSYPWWIPTYSTLATVAIAIAAWSQRGGPSAPVAATVALVLSLSSLLLWIPKAWMMPPWVEAIVVTIAVVLYLSEPVSADLAPLLFLIVAGEVAATTRVWLGLVAALAYSGVLVMAVYVQNLDNGLIYIIGVVAGADVGIALRWQMRALAAERTNTSIAQERAILSERQRLAREVHDVVGHSLSINLLHVTAARHSLEKHADIADAIESLREAERVGRSAMGDLRRTVAVLAAGPSDTQPMPGVDDIASLVERSRAAGLDVEYSRSGDPVVLGDAAGLGVFRVLQESLGNVARHAPRSAATVVLVETPDAVTLTVRNTLPDGAPEPRDGGSGLPGMAARAEQLGAELRAGVAGDAWLVELVVPIRRADWAVAPA